MGRRTPPRPGSRFSRNSFMPSTLTAFCRSPSASGEQQRCVRPTSRGWPFAAPRPVGVGRTGAQRERVRRALPALRRGRQGRVLSTAGPAGRLSSAHHRRPNGRAALLPTRAGAAGESGQPGPEAEAATAEGTDAPQAVTAKGPATRGYPGMTLQPQTTFLRDLHRYEYHEAGIEVRLGALR